MPKPGNGQTPEDANDTAPVDTASLDDILEPLLKTVKDEVLSYLTAQVKPLVDRVASIETSLATATAGQNPDTAQNPTESTQPASAVLEARLAELERREREANEARVRAETEQKRQESLTKLQASINEVLDGTEHLLHRDHLSKALYRELLETAEDVNGQWVTKDGKTSASEYVTNYLSTDVGKHFIGVTVPNGGNTPRVNNKTTSGTQPVSLTDVVTKVKW